MRSLRLGGQGPGALALADDVENGGYARIHDAHVLVTDALEQPISHLVGKDEFNLDGQIACELKEMLLMQHAVTTEAGDGAECGAAVNAQFLGVLEQPFV